MHNSYVGFFVDGDLGNPNDDFAASHRTKRMGIVYNGDPIDENSGFSTGYGLNPPAIAYQIIKTPNDATGNPAELSSVMTPYNGTSPTSDPNNASEYYNYMKGVWRDGTPATMGGNGYDRSNGTLYCRLQHIHSPNIYNRRFWTVFLYQTWGLVDISFLYN